MKRVFLLAQAAVLLCLAAAPARAQELDTAVTVASGSGLSLGQGDAEVLKKMSPVFLEVDVGLIFDGDRSLEWTPSLIMELTGRVSVGVNPSLKRVWQFGKLSLYAGIGFPFYFAPFSMLGVEPAIGATYNIFSRFSLALELHADVFFVGSDLPEDSIVVKMDASLGIRIDL